ncbi:F0F1 ATP synthase subunit B [Candidatus Enterovibrio altilux]|uniref:ATP synthase subunit b n=1 Tax=Candidatus Enterovibrio altilux TaxID=1927128 RepID=A0A291B944_9GAMM|nr:F0F1 ATP synthase subunit B [Candidatus Enterovibrio luxaltus]ATF09515.1 ATP synthase F0 sector subunit b [Candidatus Enterovibrio luxaltus]
MNINATLFGQAIVFFIFVWFCMKYIWPPLTQTIEKRQELITDGLVAAKRAVKELDLAKANASDQLKEAKHIAAAIIEQANKRKVQILNEAHTSAIAERDNILYQGKAELAAERNHIRDHLRKQVAYLAVIAAEKILKRSIDANAHRDIFEKITTKL